VAHAFHLPNTAHYYRTAFPDTLPHPAHTSTAYHTDCRTIPAVPPLAGHVKRKGEHTKRATAAGRRVHWWPLGPFPAFMPVLGRRTTCALHRTTSPSFLQQARTYPWTAVVHATA